MNRSFLFISEFSIVTFTRLYFYGLVGAPPSRFCKRMEDLRKFKLLPFQDIVKLHQTKNKDFPIIADPVYSLLVCDK